MINEESLRAEVKSEKRIHGYACKLSEFFKSKNPEEARAFAAIAFDRELPVLPTLRILSKHGYSMGEQSIRRHRDAPCEHCATVLKSMNGGA